MKFRKFDGKAIGAVVPEFKAIISPLTKIFLKLLCSHWNSASGTAIQITTIAPEEVRFFSCRGEWYSGAGRGISVPLILV